MAMQPGPNLGAETTLGGISGGLADLLKGFVQGRELRRQDQREDAELQTQRAQLGETMATKYKTELAAHPELAQNPNYLKVLQGHAKQFGFALPTDAEGNLDVNAFAPRQRLDLPPTDLEKIGAMQPAMRQAYRRAQEAQGIDTSQYGDDFWTAPAQLPITQTDKTQAEIAVRDAMGLVAKGTMPAAQFFAILDANRQTLGDAYVNSLVNAHPEAFTQLSATTDAKLQSILQANKYVDQAKLLRAQADLRNADSLSTFRSAQAKHFENMDRTAAGRLQATIAENKIKNQEAEERIAVSRERVEKGTSTLGTAKTDAAALNAFVHTQESVLAGYQRQQAALINAGTDPDDPTMQTLQTEIDAVQGKISEYSGYAQAATDYIKSGAAANQAIQNAGGPPIAGAPTAGKTVQGSDGGTYVQQPNGKWKRIK